MMILVDPERAARWDRAHRLQALRDLIAEAIDRAAERGDWAEHDRLDDRWWAVMGGPRWS